MADEVRYDQRGRIALITLNRPQYANAQNSAMTYALDAAFTRAVNDDEVAAVCEVARQRGKRVAAHARSAESVKMSLRHGAEIIYHATFADAEARTMNHPG